ncbi:Origin recognition complex subunit 5 [Dionaea muscipula]
MPKDMGLDGSPQIPRRTTRLAAIAAASSSSIAHRPTLDDLVLGHEPLSLGNLYSCFPGRHSQIVDVLRLLGPLNSPMLPIFVYGGSSTGKTSVILQVFRHLKRPFAYASCLTCYCPRILFESILNQLMFHQRDEEHFYSSAKRCERPSDFANFLKVALTNIIDNLRGSSDVKGSMVYLIIDNLELVRDWDKSSIVLPFLFGLYRTLGLPEVGLIFISKTSLDTYHSDSCYLEPIPVYFPAYTEKDLRQIFQQKQGNSKLYSSFLDIVLKQFYRRTRRLDELSTALSQLFQKCCEPAGELEKDDAKRRLFKNLEPCITPALNEVFSISSFGVQEDTQRSKGKGNSRKLVDLETEEEEINFHMPTSAKYLLLSAFLASKNPATHDASFFDSNGGLDNRKRKRKSSEKVMEQKEMVEQDLIMKGPGTFPLERLLAIFQLIINPVAEIAIDGEEDELMSDVLLQLSSLCSANFISKGGSCPLEGSIRYKCIISEELAIKIAKSLKFPLSKYLARR